MGEDRQMAFSKNKKMTDKSLMILIDKLNEKKTNDLIHLRPLSATVDFAKVWEERPKPNDSVSCSGPYNIYFIKNTSGLYVAAVLDMWLGNLHWFVDSKHRRQGHLRKAMREVIIYHLFQDPDREDQKITIDKNQIGDKNFNASEKAAFSLGFEKLNNNKNEYILTKIKYQTDKYIVGHNTQLTIQRVEELKQQLNYLRRSLWVIQSEIEMKLGSTDYAEELKKLVEEITKHTWKLEDAWLDSKNSTL